MTPNSSPPTLMPLTWYRHEGLFHAVLFQTGSWSTTACLLMLKDPRGFVQTDLHAPPRKVCPRCRNLLVAPQPDSLDLGPKMAMVPWLDDDSGKAHAVWNLDDPRIDDPLTFCGQIKWVYRLKEPAEVRKACRTCVEAIRVLPIPSADPDRIRQIVQEGIARY